MPPGVKPTAASTAGSAVLASTWPLEPNTDRQSTSPLRRIRRGAPDPGLAWAGT